jgi:hypothetical protein
MADGAADDGPDTATDGVGDANGDAASDATTEELRERVEKEYDFENFGPQEMAEMSSEEWEAAFDPETWITGTELLDRVEADMKARVARRDVFAVIERESKGTEERLVAYSDEGYAIVYEDGTVEGRGTVLRDLKPSVALCSMEDYDVPDAPERGLPDPESVPESTGSIGHTLMLAVGVAQLVAAVLLFGGWILTDIGVVAAVAALGFGAFGVFMLVLVANARLSDRFRSEEYRERLRDAGATGSERPAFVPNWEGSDPDERE